MFNNFFIFVKHIKQSLQKKNDINKCDLIVITVEPFPVGLAATNRMLSYLTVLARRLKIILYIARPTENPLFPLNKKPRGEYNKIYYEYISKTTTWPKGKNKLIKAWIVASSLLKIIYELIKKRPKSVILYNNITYISIPLLLSKQICRFNFYIEENEYPKILSKNKYPRLIKKLNLWIYTRADGMIVMTKELYNWYKSLGVKKLFHLPMTVNKDTYLNIPIKCNNEFGRYFVYLGAGGVLRDGLLDILEGFYYFITKNKVDVKLLLIGPFINDSKIMKPLKSFIKEKGIENNVIFTGFLEREKVFKLLKCSLGCVMAPEKDFETGGFPTKLGDYLLSGRPVIISKVSEIGDYLNEKNAFLIRPKNPIDISMAMEYILKNQVYSNEIGLNGKQTALTVFNAETYIDGLIDFINKVDY